MDKKQDIYISLINEYKDKIIWICFDGNMDSLKEIREYSPGPNINFVFNKRRRDVVISYNKIMGMIKNSGAILYASDDLVFYPQTITIAVNQLQRMFPDTDGVIGLNQYQDGRMKGRKYAFALMGRKFVERYPDYMVFCPDYIHFNSDREIGFHAKTLNRFHFCPEAKIVHIRLKDNTTALGRVVYARDKAVYRERQARKILWGMSDQLISKEMNL